MSSRTKLRKKPSRRGKARSLDSYIVVTPGTCAGKPRIAGRRISVQNVAIWHERLGMSVDEIADQFDLSLVEIHAALAYFFEHRAEIEKRIRADAELAREFFKNHRSPLQDKLIEMGVADDPFD